MGSHRRPDSVVAIRTAARVYLYLFTVIAIRGRPAAVLEERERERGEVGERRIMMDDGARLHNRPASPTGGCYPKLTAYPKTRTQQCQNQAMPIRRNRRAPLGKRRVNRLSVLHPSRGLRLPAATTTMTMSTASSTRRRER